MADGKNKGGRPQSTPEEVKARKDLLLQKIEPYLKTGLSVNKALGEAQIANSEFYRYMEEDEGFRERITVFRNFVPVLLNNILVGELMDISARQNPAKGIKKNKLTKEDKEFLWNFAKLSNLTKGEFGERKHIDLFDPEAEIQKVKGLIDESSSEEISHDD